MKYIVYLFAFIIVLNINAQTYLPGKLRISNTADSFMIAKPQKHILCGSWWGHDLRVSNNLRMNLAQATVGANLGPSRVFHPELYNVQHNDNYVFNTYSNRIKVLLLPSFAAFPYLASVFQFKSI